MVDTQKQEPLTDEEIAWIRTDKQRSEAFGIVWNSMKNIGGIILGLIAAYWAFWDFLKAVIKGAAA